MHSSTILVHLGLCKHSNLIALLHLASIDAPDQQDFTLRVATAASLEEQSLWSFSRHMLQDGSMET